MSERSERLGNVVTDRLQDYVDVAYQAGMDDAHTEKLTIFETPMATKDVLRAICEELGVTEEKLRWLSGLDDDLYDAVATLLEASKP